MSKKACAVDWSNPYEGASRGVWLKGNLHTHTREGSGCAQMSMSEALDRYAKLGYDFLCLSNHMTLTPARPGAVRPLMLLPGIEWNSARGDHMTVCSFHPLVLRHCLKARDASSLARYLAKQPALTVLNHPNWQEPPHYSREILAERMPVSGIEIYNAVIERLIGHALATDKWDYLLSRGHRILGFASDDAHALEDIGQGWIMVRAAARTPRAVLDAMLRGRFYSSTGITINSLRRRGTRVVVETADAEEIWAMGSGGVRLARVHTRRMDFEFGGRKTAYVRFVAFGRGAAMAWTQPFFADAADDKGGRPE